MSLALAPRSHGILLLALLAFAPATLLAADPSPPYQVELQKDVVYGTGAGQQLTLHLARPLAAPEPLPVIAYIHGGGWRAGDKGLHLDDIQQAAARGYLSVSIGYRFVPDHCWPAQIEDVKCAIRYLRQHASQLKLDPARIGAIGFSAGAHLSMLLGTMGAADGFEGQGGWPDQPSQVQAVVAYFGPTQFVGVEFPSLSRPLVAGFLGGPEASQPDNYRAASPVTYVSPGDAPTLIFQGTQDILVPYEQAFLMTTALTKARVPGRAEILFGLGHGWAKQDLEHTQHHAWDFFDHHLRAPANP